MNSFLNTHNGTSLTGIVDITANSMSLFQDNGPPKSFIDIFIPKIDISIAEPYDVQIDENGNVIQMYQFIGDINDTKVAGLESILYHINDNFFSKADPAVNENYYNITKNNIIKIYIIIIILIKVSLITLRIIDIQMNITIIKPIHNKQFNEVHNQKK